MTSIQSKPQRTQRTQRYEAGRGWHSASATLWWQCFDYEDEEECDAQGGLTFYASQFLRLKRSVVSAMLRTERSRPAPGSRC